MKKTIYFVRHAQSAPSNSLPDSEWPLSRTGKEQSIKLAALLVPLGIERIVSSPYVRCLRTIEPFADAVGMKVEQRLGLHERRISKTLIEDFYSVWCQSWDDFDFALPGCESNHQAQQRFLEAVRVVIRECESQTIGICAHGAVIGLLLHAIADGAGREQAEALTNPDVLRVVVDGEAWNWDRSFQLPGLHFVSSHHADTPIDLDSPSSPKRNEG
ncbi:histidine phosphatase family protein [Candidatus Bipolaricaulota bacterium]